MALSEVPLAEGESEREEPIDLAAAKRQCLIPLDVTDQDLQIQDIYMPAARERAEAGTDRVFVTQAWDLLLDGFPDDDWIEIPKPPLQSVTFVRYRDQSGTVQTWPASNYTVDAPKGARCLRGRLCLVPGSSWPSTFGQAGDVQIRFVAGYGTKQAVPALLKLGMLLDVGAMYVGREGVITGTSVAVHPLAAGIYRSFVAPATQGRGR
jgi:uncharacterized phiE125 gp8 family phage protein